MPLRGAVPESPYPIELPVSGAGSFRTTGPGCRARLDATVVAARVDTYLPAELFRADPQSGLQVERDAFKGRRFLIVEVDVANPDGQPCPRSASTVDDADFSLNEDNLALLPTFTTAKTVAKGRTARLTVAFLILQKSSNVTLLLGTPDAEQASIPIALPPLPRFPGE